MGRDESKPASSRKLFGTSLFSLIWGDYCAAIPPSPIRVHLLRQDAPTTSWRCCLVRTAASERHLAGLSSRLCWYLFLLVKTVQAQTARVGGVEEERLFGDENAKEG